ncbi:MAG: hypothetical protein HYT16_00220 [DPANN group archaeon]|nr:hypothetical protein [DPANN group archaeon]
MDISKAEEKLKFADYLLHRSELEFLGAAMRHVLEASNVAVAVNFGLDDTNIAHQIINRKLSEGSKEEREFSGTYLSLWKLATNPSPAKSDVAKSLARVKTFVEYVKARRSFGAQSLV